MKGWMLAGAMLLTLAACGDGEGGNRDPESGTNVETENTGDTGGGDGAGDTNGGTGEEDNLGFPGVEGITGNIQKGPFIIGSSITIQELDEDLNPTGTSFSTETTNDLGAFTLASAISAQFVEITSDGFYYDEVADGLSTARLTLRTVSDLADGNNIKINILTSLAKQRLKNIFAGSATFAEARQQAQIDILSAFNIQDDGTSNFDQMDIAETGDANAMLLAVSAILQQMAHNRAPESPVAELSFILSTIGTNLESDGLLNSPELEADLLTASTTLDLAAIRANLETRYANLGSAISAPDFEGYVDSDGDGLLNMHDFLIVFDAIHTSTLSTSYTSNEIIVVLHPDTSSMPANITNGSIIINGSDTLLKNIDVQSGERIAIKLMSNTIYESIETINASTLTIGSNDGAFEVILQYPQPTLIGYYSNGKMNDVKLVKNDSYAVVVGRDIVIVDLTDPTNPLMTSSLDQNVDHITTFQNGNRAFVTGITNMAIIDISDVNIPITVWQQNIESLRTGKARISKDNNFAYVVDLISGLRIYNISVQSAPILLSTTILDQNCTMFSNCGPNDIVVINSENTAIVSNLNSGLIVVDISNKSNPSIKLDYNLGESFSYAWHVEVSQDENLLFVSGTTNQGSIGLHIIDISDILSPANIGVYPIQLGNIVFSQDGTKMYGGGGNIGFHIVNISDPTDPKLLGSFYEVISSTAPKVSGVAISSDEKIAYITETWNGLRVVDIDPTN